MGTIRKSRLIVGGIAAVLLLAAIVEGPGLLQADRYRPQLISYLARKTGKHVEMGRLALAFFPLSIHIDHFGVKNPPIFPPGYVIQVGRIDAVLNVTALLHRRLAITSLVLEDPVLNLTSDPDGPWNFENAQATASQGALPLDVISRVRIERGHVIASNLLPSDAPGPIFFEAHEISADLKQVNLAGIMNPSSSSMDGQGRLTASQLRLGWVEARRLDSALLLGHRQVAFENVKAEVYGGSAAGELRFDLSGKNATFKTQGQLRSVNLARLLAAFPHGGAKMTGTMEGDVTLWGDIAHSLRPLEGIHGAGRVTVRNGQVPSLELNKNVMKLAHFNDLGPARKEPSSFTLITADLELNNQRISSKVIDIDGYGVDIDGSGTVSLSGSNALNYRGLAEITTRQGFFTNVVARLSGATLKDGLLQFPFRIDGTMDNPVFSRGKAQKDVDAVKRHR